MSGFNLRAFGLIANFNYTPGGSNNSLFGYGTTDAIATVLTAGYFNDARDKGKIAANDIVIGVANGKPFCIQFATVPSSGDVTTTMANLTGSDLSTLTDSSGGTASDTLASIAAGASYAQADMVAVKNAIASLAAKINAMIG